MIDLVFVYGTLRRDEVNAGLLRDAECISEKAYVRGRLYDTGCGYPALTLSGHQRVQGEVYRIDAPTLKRLDELEDYYAKGDPRNLYERVSVTVHTEQGDMRVWTYIFLEEQASQLELIGTGDWLKSTENE
ncbi:gamma-glutamylcyclotransferase family protein [Paenibacillus marinisediminis]